MNDVPYTYMLGVSSCVADPHLRSIPLTDASMGCQSFGVWSGTNASGGATVSAVKAAAAVKLAWLDDGMGHSGCTCLYSS